MLEQVIAIAVFAVFAAVCSAIIINAFFTASDAKDINYALIAAKNGAEAYQIYGSPQEAAESLGGSARGAAGADVYYDRNWRVCDEPNAAYVLRLDTVADTSLGELTVERINGEELISFTVSAGPVSNIP